jgi:hypothetical protein
MDVFVEAPHAIMFYYTLERGSMKETESGGAALAIQTVPTRPVPYGVFPVKYNKIKPVGGRRFVVVALRCGAVRWCRGAVLILFPPAH